MRRLRQLGVTPTPQELVSQVVGLLVQLDLDLLADLVLLLVLVPVLLPVVVWSIHQQQGDSIHHRQCFW